MVNGIFIPNFDDAQLLEVEINDLLPGDVLFHMPGNPSFRQGVISWAIDSPYTHASIYLGEGKIAEALSEGVVVSSLEQALNASRCLAVLRTQLGFENDRPAKLNAFIQNLVDEQTEYDFIGALTLGLERVQNGRNSKAAKLFAKKIKEGLSRYAGENPEAKLTFFCSALVASCFGVVGIIGESAKPFYLPDHFSPKDLFEEPTFGWLLGYLLPDCAKVPEGDPLQFHTLWINITDPDVRWWE